jgi:hypothetical protein
MSVTGRCQHLGGGVAIIYKANIDFKMLTSSSDGHFSTFEYIDCNIAINKNSLRLSVIYRPPPSQQNGLAVFDIRWEQAYYSMFYPPYYQAKSR